MLLEGQRLKKRIGANTYTELGKGICPEESGKKSRAIRNLLHAERDSGWVTREHKLTGSLPTENAFFKHESRC